MKYVLLVAWFAVVAYAMLRNGQGDDAEDLVKKELDQQKNGSICTDCWVPQPAEHVIFKNLIDYEVVDTFHCTFHDNNVEGIQGVKIKAKAQNGFGASSWSIYDALAVESGGKWKLTYLDENPGHETCKVAVFAGIIADGKVVH